MSKFRQFGKGEKKIKSWGLSDEEILKVKEVIGQEVPKQEVVQEAPKQDTVDLGSDVHTALGLFRDNSLTYNLVVVKYNPVSGKATVEKVETLSRDIIHAIEKFKIESGNQVLP